MSILPVVLGYNVPNKLIKWQIPSFITNENKVWVSEEEIN